ATTVGISLAEGRTWRQGSAARRGCLRPGGSLQFSRSCIATRDSAYRSELDGLEESAASGPFTRQPAGRHLWSNEYLTFSATSRSIAETAWRSKEPKPPSTKRHYTLPSRTLRLNGIGAINARQPCWTFARRVD